MDMTGLPILSAIVFGPLIGALVIAFLPRQETQLIRWVALIVSLLVWGLSILLALGFQSGAGDFQLEEKAAWIPAFGINYHLGIDGISLVLVLLTTTLTWISILASFKPITDRVKEYMISFLILEVGMLGVFLALDLFLFYIFWEIVLVPMYLIIGIWGGPNRIYATLKFVLYTLVGSLLMLVAILATAFSFQAAQGTWDGAFDYLTLRTFGFDGTLQLLAFLAFFLAFAIKVPMWPFHTWLPDAHVEAPTAGSVILAGVMLKLGGYGLIRFAVPLFPQAAADLAGIMIVLSLIAIIYGAIVAMVQPDLKKLVAYSSVSHMGFVTLGIFIFQQQGLQGAILQMVNHGVITGALFLCVGVIYDRTHDRTIAKMGGLAGRTPVYAMLFGFFMLASLGLPGLSGFVGEFLVFLGTFVYSPIAAGIAAIVMIIGAAYLMWMYQRVVFGELSDFLKSLGHHLTDINRIELVTLTPLVALTLLLGLFPGLILDLVSAPVGQILASVGHGAGVALGR
ncbi:MAG: NADH-quinone oxidoreductase subunit [Chloroflexota bacterium]|jgi:NADH-quinone oxidoreductase subunit M|nr:NADH-quinone oxidoreductase subunit [Chloroflexota bacterium]